MRRTLGQIAYEAYENDPLGGTWWRMQTEQARARFDAAAAAVAAEVRREMGWRPIAEAPDDRALFVGAWDESGVWCCHGPMSRVGAIDLGYTHYLPQPDPPQQEPQA